MINLGTPDSFGRSDEATSDLLRELIAEQQRTNALLQQAADAKRHEEMEEFAEQLAKEHGVPRWHVGVAFGDDNTVAWAVRPKAEKKEVTP